MANDYEKEKKYNSLLSNYLGKEEIKKLAKKIINLKSKLLNITDLMKKEKIDDGTNDLENFLNSSYYQLIDIKMKMARSYFNEKNIKNYFNPRFSISYQCL